MRSDGDLIVERQKDPRRMQWQKKKFINTKICCTDRRWAAHNELIKKKCIHHKKGTETTPVNIVR